ncbi:hypothetical protein C2845_PM07G31740 [Panicum miliaceum]|uniref:KIB1-4 beta-propeller domain-containing protein n=1 Tax=Panicum miliaceum TaxID=4540 RepID=A0A3L6SLR3_PANMI|nr:hypothetical protein C2845_PM07G31740 [Panicum miliaceum]
MSRLDLPCIAFHDSDHRSTVMLSLSEHKRIAAGDTDEVLRNKIVSPTAQGFLLVRDPDTMATFLYNPSSSDKVQLPPLRGVDDDVLMDSHCLLSDKPAAPGCVVLLVEGWDDTFIWYCHPDDDHWEKYEYDIGSHVLPYPDKEEDQIEKNVICSIAACHGKFYFDCSAKEMRVIDFSSPEPVFTAIAIDHTVPADGSHGYDEQLPCRMFLVESNGELYMVRLLFGSPYEGGDDIDRVSVHKMDFLKRRWFYVHDLGGRAFLLSQFYFGASCSASECGLLPNRVYFMFDRNNSLQVFDVKDGTYQLHKLGEAPMKVDKAFWLLPISP